MALWADSNRALGDHSTRIAAVEGGAVSAADSKGSGSTHLAPGPALGYAYQFQVALLELLPHALSHSDATVQLEVLDDVSLDFQEGAPPKVIQVHQEAGTRRLTDRSAKVWKTLGIWSREQKDLPDGQSREMSLFSTQTTQEGSGVAHLTQGKYEPRTAAELLEAVASDPNGAEGTADDRAAFLDLDQPTRLDLLSRVTVIDGATSPVDVHKALVEALLPTHETKFVDSMAKIIEGWWWRKLPTALNDGTPIHAEELRSQIDEARRMHSDSALPILKSLNEFDASELPDGSQDGSYSFLECLAEVSASEQRQHRAVSDYRLAFAHRSRWTRSGLLGFQEIDRYDDNLIGQWSTGCDQMLRHLAPDANGGAKATAGHDLWDDMERGIFRPIRPETTDEFIQRGSFHQLANQERLSWHPDSAGPIYRDGEKASGEQ
jgi:hypothetical protein